MLTEEGAEVIWEAALPGLAGATLRVWEENYSNSVEKPLDEGFPQRNGRAAIFQATYQGDEANFVWSHWEVALGEKILDSGSSDQGRKVEGSVWAFAVAIDLLPEEPTLGG